MDKFQATITDFVISVIIVNILSNLNSNNPTITSVFSMKMPLDVKKNEFLAETLPFKNINQKLKIEKIMEETDRQMFEAKDDDDDEAIVIGSKSLIVRS